MELVLSLINSLNELHHTSQKFQQQLKSLFNDIATPEDREFLGSRVEAGAQYFSTQLFTAHIVLMRIHQEKLKGKKGIKAYSNDLKRLIELFQDQVERTQKSVVIVRELWGKVSVDNPAGTLKPD